MEQLFSDLEKTTHISTHGDYMHMITENGDKIIKASDFVKEMSDGELIKEGAIDSQTSNLFLSDACVPIQEIVRMESEAFDRICTEVNVYAGSD